MKTQNHTLKNLSIKSISKLFILLLALVIMALGVSSGVLAEPGANGGADLSSYEAPTNCNVTVSTASNVESKIQNNEVVCVDSDLNEQLTIDVSGVTVAATTQGIAVDLQNSSGPGVKINADDVTFTGFKVANVGSDGDDGPSGQGIAVNSNYGSTDTRLSGITLSYLEVTENYDKAVVVDFSDDVTVSNVHSHNNRGADWDDEGGGYVSDGITFWGTENSVMKHITSNNNGDNGVYFDGANNYGKDILAYDNGDQGIDISPDHSHHGTDGYNPQGGTELVNVTSRDNTEPGIEVEDNENKVIIKKANLKNNGGQSILVTDKQEGDSNANVEITYSNISGLAENQNSNVLLIAKNNYWGQSSGPGETQVSGDINYTPWYATADFSEDVKVVKPSDETRAYSGTIQGAINAAESGDSIEVAAGVYNEHITVGTSGLTLEGPNSDTKGYEERNNEAIIEEGVDVKAENVTLKGFEIRNAGEQGNADPTNYAGLVGVNVHTENENVIVKNNIIKDIAVNDDDANPIGIYASDGTVGITIDSNKFINLEGTDEDEGAVQAILIDESGTQITDTKVTDNLITDLLDTRSTVAVRYNGDVKGKISGNNISNLNTEGETNQGNPGGFTQVISLAKGGASETGPSDVTVSENTITEIETTTAENWARPYGILVGGSADVDSIRVNANNINLDQNKDSRTTIAVGIANGASETLNASNNFWGNSTPNFNGTVSGDVNFLPYCQDKNCTEVSDENESLLLVNNSFAGDKYERITVDGSDYYYNHTAFSSIQDAIDSAESGDTIEVAAGNYSPFDVNKNLEVVAQNSPFSGDSATIKAEGLMAAVDITAQGASVKGFEAIADNNGDRDNARGIDVKADNVRVEGNYVHNIVSRVRPIGIHVFGKNVDTNGTVVTDNLIEDVKATALDGCSECGQGESKTRGVVINGPNKSTNNSNIYVTNNTIRDIGNNQSNMSNAIEVHGGTAQNFHIMYNDISAIDHQPSETYPVALGFYITGYNKEIDYGNNYEVSHNEFSLGGTRTYGVATYGVPHAGILNIAKNYWALPDPSLTVAGDVNATPWYEDEDMTILREVTNTKAVKDAKEMLNLSTILGNNDNASNVTENLNLVFTTDYGVSIEWNSTNASVIRTSDGKVTRPDKGEGNATVNLTAGISRNNISMSESFVFNVTEESMNDTEAVNESYHELGFDELDSFNTTKDLELPKGGGQYGTSISWSSNNEDVITEEGTVIRQSDNVTVEITATISKGDVSREKVISVKVLGTDKITLYEAKQELTDYKVLNGNPGKENILGDLNFPSSGLEGVIIEWNTSNSSVIDENGSVERSTIADKEVMVNATLIINKQNITKTFLFTVKKKVAAKQKENITVEEGESEVVMDPTNAKKVSEVNVPENVPEEVTLNFQDVFPLSKDLTLERETSAMNYSIDLEKGTVIEGVQDWNRLFKILTAKEADDYSISDADTIDSVVELGSSTKLNLSKKAKITLSGMAGKTAAWSHGPGEMNPIDECGNDITKEETPCYTDSDGDLLIWSDHLTEFAAYTQEEEEEETTGGGGGGGDDTTTQDNETTTVPPTVGEEETTTEEEPTPTNETEAPTTNETEEPTADNATQNVTQNETEEPGTTPITGQIISGIRDTGNVAVTVIFFAVIAGLIVFIADRRMGGMPWGNKIRRARKLHKRAEKVYKSGNHDKALELYNKAERLRK